MQCLEIYSEEIQKHKRITVEEERTADVETLCNANLRLVWKIASGHAERGVPMADLISAGNIGLFRAAQKFDRDRGIKFSTYAAWWIKQQIMREIEKKGVVRFPNNVIRNARQLIKGDYDAETALPDESEYARDLAQKCFLPNLSLSEPIDETKQASPDRSTTLVDDAPLPDEKYEETERAAFIDHCLGKLTDREADVVRRYYGVGYPHAQTMQEIGDVYQISKERVRQLINVVKRKLSHLKREGAEWAR